MAIGTSLGAMFDDEFHFQQNQHDSANYPDNNTIDPETTPDLNTNDNNVKPVSSPPSGITIRPISDVQEVPQPQSTIDTPTPSRFSILNTIRGMVGGSEESVKNLPTNAVEAVKGMVDVLRSPGEALKGKLPGWAMDPDTGEFNTSQQMIEKAVGLATMMVTGPAPVASSMADGTLGSFMGVKSKTINKENLYKAQDMEFAAEHPDAIYDATKTFRGADGRWRQEIPDTNMKLKSDMFMQSPNNANNIKLIDKYDKANLFGEKSKLFLKDVIDHPALFEAYPHLKNIKVEPVNGFEAIAGMKGAYRASDNVLKIGRQSEEEMRLTLMHEIQHAIQGHEGFSSGASTMMFKSPEIEQQEQLFNKAWDKTKAQMRDDGLTDKEINNALAAYHAEHTGETHWDFNGRKVIKSSYEKNKADLDKLDSAGYRNQLKTKVEGDLFLREQNDKAFQDYLRTMGEVESRNVELRMSLKHLSKSFEDGKISPLQTERDIMPREKQIPSPLDIKPAY